MHIVYIITAIDYLKQDDRTCVVLFILFMTMIANFMIHIPCRSEIDDVSSKKS